jgi:hypothetical protein
VSSLFCRHNRFTADCPICSKGTVLDSSRDAGHGPRQKPASRGSRRRGRGDAAPSQFAGPYVTAGPYEREDGATYEVRLERVPGGVRLAQWSGGRLERRAPELAASDLAALVAGAAERELLPPGDLEVLSAALRAEPDAAAAREKAGASPGEAGDLREELRVERCEGDRVRVGRWLLYPSRGWELQDAPTMLPAARYAEAIRGAARLGLLGAGVP